MYLEDMQREISILTVCLPTGIPPKKLHCYCGLTLMYVPCADCVASAGHTIVTRPTTYTLPPTYQAD
jgi:hypothetical protein